jgi:hypothetical protein
MSVPHQHEIAAIGAALAVLASGCTRSFEARAQNWYDARTPHVHLQTDGGERRAREAAAQFETLHRALEVVFFHCATGDLDPVEVTLLSNDDEYDAVASADTAGVFLHDVDGLAPLPPRVVIRVAALDLGGQQVFMHELTHRFVDACFTMAPTWLHEGLASVFETVTVRSGRVLFGQPRYRVNDTPYSDLFLENGSYVYELPSSLVPVPSAVRALSSASFYTPERSADGHSSGSVRSGNYAGAWALAYYLALGPDAAMRERFIRYLSTISSGSEDQENAFEVEFYGTSLDRAVPSYVRAGHFRALSRPLPDAVAAVVPQVVAIPPAQAHLRLAELELSSAHASSTSAAAHLELAAADPTTRARALFLRAALVPDAAASAGLQEAVELAPDDLDILRARTMIASGAGDVAEAGRLAALLAARADVRAVDLIVIAEVERVGAHLDEAYEHAREAVHRSATSCFAWFELGRVAFDRGDLALARRAMRLVQHLATHGGATLAAQAREWITRIDSAHIVPRSPTDPAYVPPAPVPTNSPP